jgi:hypothetical protein
MSFRLPAAFALLATTLLLVLLTLLQSRQRRREVATLFVWRELRDSVSSRAQRLRSLLDPLFLIQLAALLAAVLAIAQPVWTSKHLGLSSLALLVDASASMSTQTEEGLTRYQSAVRRADEILALYAPSSVSVVLLSRTPQTLIANQSDRNAVRKALAASEPCWEGDAQASDLVRGIEAVGGSSEYEQIVLLTDHSPALAPFPLRVEILAGGSGVGITAFSVRENTNGMGVSAFAKLRNETAEMLALDLQIADETSRTTLEAFIGPHEETAYVVPFPTSRGSQFVASLAAPDPSPYDNVRYASLRRSPGLRVRWIGRANRYLEAALAAAAPIVRVDSPPADLTIVYDATLDALPEGNLLVFHSTVREVIKLSESATSGVARSLGEDPLLEGVRADDIYAEQLPRMDTLLPSRVLLSVGESPFLLRIIDPDRLVVVFPSSLVATNLPITVDFPLLIRNLVEQVTPSQPTTVSSWTLVGTPVPLPSRSAPLQVSDPQGQPIDLLPDQQVFFPDDPGQYSIRTGSDVLGLSVNVDPGETSGAVVPQAASRADVSVSPLSPAPRERSSNLWPIAAGAGLALLLAEFHLYRRRHSEPRRPL